MFNKTYSHIPVKNDVVELLKECELLYRKSHPELEDFKISKSKMLKLVCEWYLK